ncbi:ABC transporter permease [Lysinibacillus piscis]|uniref:ABC-2 type transporter transmembrane domain-containing protein n=1 Tax=Lysinibacillus piscis TaxID=2518931 RepID=A0ABQ5NQE3_9BACI|nr:ABC transporter permease [Lysinibacillus sp. KH24]GLC90542.1 hypothetical protein LYSBPC_36690 [Lysinibacillus sp. KH24]
MFLALIQKQLKLIWRSPQELLILLGMPIALISIIGFALGSLLDGNSEAIQIKVAFAMHEDENVALETFVQDKGETFGIGRNMLPSLQQMLPIATLRKEVFDNEEMTSFLQVTTITPQEIAKAKQDDVYDAIIEVPSGFTEQFLLSIFEQDTAPVLPIYLNDDKEIATTVVKRIVDTYQYQFTLMNALAEQGMIEADFTIPIAKVSSSIETVNGQQPVSVSAYYSFSMGVMFIMYWVGTIAGQAFLEKDKHIFDRILLANINPAIYLVAIIISTVFLAMLQMLILFIFAHLVFDVSYGPWSLYIVTTFMIALVVGGLTAVLSAINYKFNSVSASNLFGSSIVAILALLGGSFFNLSSIMPDIARIGYFTPNGAALQSYLTIQQGGNLAQIMPYLSTLGVLAIMFFVCAFLVFPKRGGIA